MTINDFCAQLGDAGAEVVSAENGKVAVDLATTQPFDLILMDMQMPVLDGYGHTRATPPGAGYSDRRAHGMRHGGRSRKCIASGCSDYLTKPTTEELLRERLIDT